MPTVKVTMFHRIAPTSAATATGMVMAFSAITSLPTVRATAVPKMNGPAALATAASNREARGPSARDEITVATTLAESIRPFQKSNTRAMPIRTSTSVGMGRSSPSSGLRRGRWPACRSSIAESADF